MKLSDFKPGTVTVPLKHPHIEQDPNVSIVIRSAQSKQYKQAEIEFVKWIEEARPDIADFSKCDGRQEIEHLTLHTVFVLSKLIVSISDPSFLEIEGDVDSDKWFEILADFENKWIVECLNEKINDVKAFYEKKSNQ